jgi:hypothetical protein
MAAWRILLGVLSEQDELKARLDPNRSRLR